MKRFKTFEDFWPFYLSQHSSRLNRQVHLFGTSLAIVAALMLIWLGEYAGLLCVPLIGYAFAWVGHFLIEKNRPATFTYPLWSLLGDFKMLHFAMRGKLEAEVTLQQNAAKSR